MSKTKHKTRIGRKTKDPKDATLLWGQFQDGTCMANGWKGSDFLFFTVPASVLEQVGAKFGEQWVCSVDGDKIVFERDGEEG